MEFYCLMFVIYYLLGGCMKRSTKLKKYYEKLSKFLFWNGILRFFIEGYLE